MVLGHDITATERTQDIRSNQDLGFDALILSERTLEGLNEAGFYKPSPVQLHGIPMGKCGFDLLLEAKSGTGKTIVFTVIALEKIDLNKGLQVIMLAPTREIASQICDVIKAVGLKYSGLCVEVVMGGLPLQDDINKFKIGRNVHIVIGSPGRLRHLIQDNFIDTSAIRLLVLDEADKLAEKSFQADINFIFSSLPTQKQVVLSSATFPESAKELISQYVNKPRHICPDSTSVLLGIEQKVSQVNANTNIVKQTHLRYEELIKILTNKDFKQCLIFCNYQARVADLYKLLTRDKWPCEQLYGLQEQTDRLEALRTLQEYKCRILISTDLAARGIDASNVDLVINFEPPYEWQTYLHRIGRAGRYGSYGTAVTVVAIGKEEFKFKEFLSIINESLNIRHFWTNDKYVLNSNNESQKCNKLQNKVSFKSKKEKPEMELSESTNNVIIEDNKMNGTATNGDTNASMFEYLWGQSNKHNNNIEIENFNDLANSFQASQSLPKFDDLLTSFEDHDSSKDDFKPELQKIYINEEQIIECINYLKKKDETPNINPKINGSEVAKNHVNSNETVKSITTNGNIKNSDECADKLKILSHEVYKHEDVDRKSYNLIKTTNPFNECVKVNKEENVDIESYNSIKTTNPYNKCDENLDELSQMAKLGLPTSFYSKADKYADNKQNSYKHTQKKPTKKPHNVKIENQAKIRENITIDNTSLNSITKIKRLDGENLLDSSLGQGYKQEYNMIHSSQQKSKNTRNVAEEDKPSKKSLKWNRNQPEKSKSQHINKQQQSNRKVNPSVNKSATKSSQNRKKVNEKEVEEDDYTLWYNALKLRTMQLEQIFYFEEMTQIRF